MILSMNKYNREIAALRQLSGEEGLHPLRKEQIKQQLLAALATETQHAPERITWLERRTAFMKYAIAILLGLSVVGGTAFASTSSKPGDLLFPVKKATEQVRLSLAGSDEAKAQLQSQFAQERVTELGEINAELKASTTPAHVEAKTEAEGEVSNALTTLTGVQAKLEAKGNTQAASAIGRTIVRLQASLNDNSDNQDNSGKVEGESDERIIIHQSATSSTSTLLNIQGKGNDRGQGNNQNENNGSSGGNATHGESNGGNKTELNINAGLDLGK